MCTVDYNLDIAKADDSLLDHMVIHSAANLRGSGLDPGNGRLTPHKERPGHFTRSDHPSDPGREPGNKSCPGL